MSEDDPDTTSGCASEPHPVTEEDHIADAGKKMAQHFLESEGEQVVRDMAGHVGDQIFELLKRQGMLMNTVAGATGMLVLAAAHILGQSHDFIARSLDGEADELAADAVATLFMENCPVVVRAALSRIGKASQS